MDWKEITPDTSGDSRRLLHSAAMYARQPNLKASGNMQSQTLYDTRQTHKKMFIGECLCTY